MHVTYPQDLICKGNIRDNTNDDDSFRRSTSIKLKIKPMHLLILELKCRLARLNHLIPRGNCLDKKGISGQSPDGNFAGPAMLQDHRTYHSCATGGRSMEDRNQRIRWADIIKEWTGVSWNITRIKTSCNHHPEFRQS